MIKIARIAAATAAVAAGLGLAGLAATDAQAQPGPFPPWCPGDYWDQGWGNNWDWERCHDNWQQDKAADPDGRRRKGRTRIRWTRIRSRRPRLGTGWTASARTASARMV